MKKKKHLFTKSKKYKLKMQVINNIKLALQPNKISVDSIPKL